MNTKCKERVSSPENRLKEALEELELLYSTCAMILPDQDLSESAPDEIANLLLSRCSEAKVWEDFARKILCVGANPSPAELRQQIEGLLLSRIKVAAERDEAEKDARRLRDDIRRVQEEPMADLMAAWPDVAWGGDVGGVGDLILNLEQTGSGKWRCIPHKGNMLAPGVAENTGTGETRAEAVAEARKKAIEMGVVTPSGVTHQPAVENLANDYVGDWTVLPAKTVEELLFKKGHDWKWFSAGMGWDTYKLASFRTGDLRMEGETASQIAKLVGYSEKTWAERDRMHARSRSVEAHDAFYAWRILPTTTKDRIQDTIRTRTRDLMSEYRNYMDVPALSEAGDKLLMVKAGQAATLALSGDREGWRNTPILQREQWLFELQVRVVAYENEEMVKLQPDYGFLTLATETTVLIAAYKAAIKTLRLPDEFQS